MGRRSTRRSTTLRAQVVVTPTGELSPGQVVIEDGVIAAVKPNDGGEVNHSVLIPGFVDLQFNGFGNIDVQNARGNDWADLDDFLLAHGTTTWCPTVRSAPLAQIDAALARIALAQARPVELRPTIAGAHVEGPFLAISGAHDPSAIAGVVDQAWFDGLHPVAKVVTIAPELPGAIGAIRSLADRGVLVSIGHSTASCEQAAEAIYSGARLLTHLGNAMAPFHHREPGLIGAGLFEWGLSVALIADLVHLHPAMVGIAFRAKHQSEVVLVTDSVATGPVPQLAVSEPPWRAGWTAGNRAVFDESGTLCGSVLTMDRALVNVVRYCRVSLTDAVRAACTNPAELLGLDDRGAIAVGKRADLVALGGHPRDARVSHAVKAVWVGGERVPAGLILAERAGR